SCGEPQTSETRVFTSQTTRTSPSLSTRSISPASHRQLRSSTTMPSSVRWRAATRSPYRPRAVRCAEEVSVVEVMHPACGDRRTVLRGGARGGGGGEQEARLWTTGGLRGEWG